MAKMKRQMIEILKKRTISDNKKAVFLTISTFFLLVNIIIMIISLYNYSVEERIERTYEIAATDRLFDLSSSVEKSLKEILSMYVNMDFATAENPDGTYNITIFDSVSRTEGEPKEEFLSQITNLKSFVEKNDKNIKLNVSGFEEKKASFFIRGYNLTYSRSWETGHVILSLTPQTLNFKSYDVLINTGTERIKKSKRTRNKKRLIFIQS